MTILLGTSGWTYDSWWGPFYPHELGDRQRLEFYAGRFPTVELNASYYRWPRDASFAGWNRRLWSGFEFTVKAPKQLTHHRRLYQPERWIEICTRGLTLLGERLGMFLVQLPPGMARDDARLDYFLGAMPSWVPVAVEFRHESWVDERVFQILERHGAAYCVMSGAHLPCVLRATSTNVYVRWHGPSHDHLYGGTYGDDDLRWWGARLLEWERSGHRVYGYFNNDANGWAPENAGRLIRFLGEG